MMTEAQIRNTSEQTRMRLLEAAREVFSQYGFQGATVREICRRAEANGAAVNYHFGSKDGLLAEALNFAPLKAMQNANVMAGECPKLRLRLFIHDLIMMLLDEKNPSSQCQIMARELADPTPALDKIVKEAIQPMHDHLGRLVHEIVGKNVNHAELRRCSQHPRTMFVLPAFASGIAASASQVTLCPQRDRSDSRAYRRVFSGRDRTS